MTGSVSNHGGDREGDGFAEKVPDGFNDWPESAQWSWLSNGPLTQREMLLFAGRKIGLTLTIEGSGPLTNEDLGRFLGALLNEGGC